MQTQLTPQEVSAIQLALQSMLADLTSSSKNPALPFNEQAKKVMADMITTANSALEKISKSAGHFATLDPYVEGDEKEFLTKES